MRTVARTLISMGMISIVGCRDAKVEARATPASASVATAPGAKPAATVAVAKLEEIRARGKLIISVKNNAPKVHKDPAHDQKRGFEIELTKVIARRVVGNEAGVELRTVPGPARLAQLANGDVDLVVSMIPMTDENARQADFSRPYFASGISLLLRDDAPSLDVTSLEGKTIAFRTQALNTFGKELERIAAERGFAVTVRYYATFQEAVAALARGEASAMGGNYVDLEHYAKAHPGFRVNTSMLEERLIGVAVKKGEADLLRVVNEAIDDLRTSGELKRMTERWHLPYLLPAT